MQEELLDQQEAVFSELYTVVETPLLKKLMYYPDALALFVFYKLTAKRQNNTSIYCTGSFVMNGLKWGEDRFRKAKKVLRELGVIEDKKTTGEDGKIKKWYIILKTTPPKNQGGGETRGVDFTPPNTNLNNINTNNNNINTKKVAFLEDSEEMQLALYLFNKIKNNNRYVKEPKYQEWAKHIDYMIRIDKITKDEVRMMIDWCQNDTFWKANILSTKKLREKFPTMYGQAKKQFEEKPKFLII